jgi:hypothetical protein
MSEPTRRRRAVETTDEDLTKMPEKSPLREVKDVAGASAHRASRWGWISHP